MQCVKCAGKLRFDPDNGKLVCGNCGGEFDVGHDSDNGPLDISSFVDDNDELAREDVNVYTCSTCGGSIVAGDSEMTSSCPFCGNNGVIFDRVANKRRPNGMIPFAFGAKKAEENVRSHLKGSVFLDKKAKNMPFVRTVGIYIPYYIVHAESKGNLIYEMTQRDKHGNIIRQDQIGRGMRCFYDRLTLEASASLTNTASLMIEPYDLPAMKEFNEGYLQGFCSDMADEDPERLLSQAEKKIREYELYQLKDSDIVPSGYVNIAYDNTVKYKGKAFYALFPVWFVVGEYKGKQVIILVNGQTGKVFGGPEYSNAMFASASLGASILPIIALSAVGAVGIGLGLVIVGRNPYAGLGIWGALITLTSSIAAMLDKKRGQVREMIDLSSSKRLIKFTSRRDR